MVDRIVELLVPALLRDGSVLVDATLGMGGHSEALLAAAPTARLVGLDRDPEALAMSRERLSRFGDRVELVHAVYDELPAVLADLGLQDAQGILFDLGVSSLQLDETRRGFSYSADAPLDMRMDPTTGMTAAEVVNTYSPRDLTRILREYGEERFAARIVTAIVRQREKRPFTTTAPLAELVREAIPAATRRTGGHPAKRTFQALRIEVNHELEVLERALPSAVASLAVSGRCAVMSYHSLEDRLTKRVFAEGTRSDVPVDMPIVPPGHEPQLRLLTRGAETASPEEVAANPRSASVKVRAVERVRAAA